jgi:hypothetical protein
MLVTYVLSGAGVGCIEPLKGLALGYCVLGLREVIPEHQIRPTKPAAGAERDPARPERAAAWHDNEYSKRNVL